MENIDKVQTLEMKVKNLQEEFQKENNFLNEVNKSIKTLREKRKETQQKLHTINGAFQAYQDSVNTFKPKVEEIPIVQELSE
jgi:uncharacterized phage infection (PIP) family protein YhgE